jgi:fluoride exporter
MEFPVTALWADDSYRQCGGSASRTRRSAGFLLAFFGLASEWERALVWSYFWIAVGSALGGVLRFLCSGLIAERIGEIFPWGTLVVNIVGSWIIGFFFTLTEPDGRLLVGTTARQFVMIGICGGFTTFSSFSLQTLNLARDGDWLRASANIVASVFLCLVAVWLGHIAAAALNR